MFKSRNLHVYLRNHHNKHAILLYTHLRNVAFNTITVTKHPTEYARFSSDKHFNTKYF